MMERVSRDKSGLVAIDGIFTTITFERFPGVDDLSVYSRWIGSGIHILKAQITDSEGNIIIETGETEFNFETPDTVYYANFEFNNIVFIKPGLYWIQVLLDDNLEFSIPLFVRSRDTELEVRGLPEEPVLILSVTAISVGKKENGLPIISGVFENFSSKRFPFAYDFVIANIWYSGNGTFTQRIEFLDPDGNIVYKSEPSSFDHSYDSLTVGYEELEDIIFYKAGKYMINIYLGDKLVLSYPLLVLQK